MYLESRQMKNELNQLHEKLQAAWSRESCSASLRAVWNREKNAAKGQCFVSALIVQDLFGGELYRLEYDTGEVHFFNRLNGDVADLTSEQFDGEIDSSFFERGILTEREEYLADPVKRQRYETLRFAMGY